jgi:hypothetical protein
MFGWSNNDTKCQVGAAKKSIETHITGVTEIEKDRSNHSPIQTR